MFFLSFKRTVFSKPIVLCRDEERVSILLPQVFFKEMCQTIESQFTRDAGGLCSNAKYSCSIPFEGKSGEKTCYNIWIEEIYCVTRHR